MRKSCDEIIEKLDLIMSDDTNAKITVVSGDKQMQRLAAELNRRLRRIRKDQLRYISGDRELKDAITNISHDLRTPLTAIMGYLQLMKEIPKSEKLEQYLEIIKGRAEAMKQLTDELFRYSVVLSEQDSQPEQTDVNKVLEDSVMSYYGAMSEKGITPTVDICEEKITRFVDPTALARVFANLMNNAIKYSGGDLAITLAQPCVITFSNKAQELSSTQVERLFDRFYTVEAAHKSTGLGLSIARTLVEQMGGTITASLEQDILTITITL
ncbi:MAG: HAMP domain-containing histidine kinase [Ruminococcus sp.]|nr:HAMP domain-containing histidine kinase [Ruminococcus sp.]